MVFIGIQFRGIFRNLSNILDGAFLKKQLMSISCYLTIFAKRLHFGCLSEFLIRLLSLCDIRYCVLWWFLKNLHKINDKYCLRNITWSGNINHKPSISWKINFLTRSQTKIIPTKAVTYPRHLFVNREVKKNKGSWDKIAHQG